MAPPSSTTSTSMVGLPRLSRISRAKTESMVVISERSKKVIGDTNSSAPQTAASFDEALLARRHDDHAAFRDRVAPAVLGGVEADARARRQLDAPVDDRAPHARMAVHGGVRQQDRVLDLAVRVDPNARAQDRAAHLAAGDDAARRH